MRHQTLCSRSAPGWRTALLFLLALLCAVLAACSPETLVLGLEPVTLQQQGSPVQSVAFSPDGSLLAVGSRSGIVRLWGVPQSQGDQWTLLLARKAAVSDAQSNFSHDVAFSPDSRTLAVGLPDGSVQLWELGHHAAEGTKPADLDVSAVRTLLIGESAICSLDFAPQGGVIAAGAEDGSVHLWQTSDGMQLWSEKGHEHRVLSVAVSPDGSTVVSTSSDSTTKVWELSSAKVVRRLTAPSAMTAITFSPDGSLLASAGAADGNRRIWSTDDWTPVRELESARGSWGNVAFSPDGSKIAAGNASYQVRWWRVHDGVLLHSTRGHSDSVWSVAFSPDGKLLASASLDGSVQLWRVP